MGNFGGIIEECTYAYHSIKQQLASDVKALSMVGYQLHVFDLDILKLGCDAIFTHHKQTKPYLHSSFYQLC